MGGLIRRTSISLPQDLLEQGQLVAKLRRRNFSNYVADLIASDLAASRQWLEDCQGEGGGKAPPSEEPPKEDKDPG